MRLPWTSRPPAPAPTPSDEPPRVPSLGNGLTVPIRPEDYPALLESLRAGELPPGVDGLYVDWDGIRTRVAMLPFAPDELSGQVSTSLPIPDDGYRSEDVEYVALAQSLATAVDTYRIVEVGAGWAPWSVAGIVQARRRGLQATGIGLNKLLRQHTSVPPLAMLLLLPCAPHPPDLQRQWQRCRLQVARHR